jgi:hypothetical protein
MKTVFFAFTALAFALGCSKSSPELIGKWKMVEVLADPGDA